MIEEVKEFFGDIKEGFGSKGLMLFVGGALLFGLYHLLKNDSSSEEVYYTPTGVVGYPSLEKNADVVIDSINNTIDGALDEALEALQYSETNVMGGFADLETNVLGAITDAKEDIHENITGAKDELSQGISGLHDDMLSNFEATNNYIQDGLTKLDDISSKIDNIDTTPRVQYIPMGGGDTITNNTVNVTDSVVGNIINGSTAENVTANVEVSNVGNTTTNSNNTTNYSTTNNTAKATSTPVTSTAKTPTATKTQTKPATYIYKTKSGLNTGGSIVDALKASGVDSSMTNRKAIAEANGIKNYTGTYTQNTALLNKLKSGDLVKPTTQQNAKAHAETYINNMLTDGI